VTFNALVKEMVAAEMARFQSTVATPRAIAG
jgi:hypothetical protein